MKVAATAGVYTQLVYYSGAGAMLSRHEVTSEHADAILAHGMVTRRQA